MPTKKLFKLYLFSLTVLLLTALFTVPAYATEDMWTAATRAFHKKGMIYQVDLAKQN